MKGAVPWFHDLPPPHVGNSGIAVGITEWVALARVLELSPQQARIVDLILRGWKDKQIAAALGISFSTVRTYLDRIFAHLGVGDRVELVLRVFAARDAAAPGVLKNAVIRNADLKPIREKEHSKQRLDGVGRRGGRAGRSVTVPRSAAKEGGADRPLTHGLGGRRS